MRTPRCATWRTRSVGSGTMPSASATSSAVGPGLHEAGRGHRGGAHRRTEPRHLLSGGVAAQRLRQSGSRPLPAGEQRCRLGGTGGERLGVDVARRVGDRGQHERVPAPPCRSRPPRPPRRSRRGGRPGSRRPSPAAGVGVRQPASSQAGDHRLERGRLGGEVGQHLVQDAMVLRHRTAWSCVPQLRVEGVRPGASGSFFRRAASSVIVFARPSPRTRSRVACTSSRTPGSALVDPEGVDRDPVRLAADPLLQGYDGSVQRLVGASGDPELESGHEHRPGEVVGEHLQHGPRAPLAARQVTRRGLDAAPHPAAR